MWPGQSTRLVLNSGYSLGDVVMLTAAVRDIHRLHPGRFLVEVRTRFPEIWEHNPRITAFGTRRGTVCVDCFPSLIRSSNNGPWHYLHALPHLLTKKLGVPVHPTEFRGEIHLSDAEKSWLSQVGELAGIEIPFWIVVTGGKFDITIKWWETARYQKVVDHFRGRIQFVLVGDVSNHHPRLEGVVDLRGKTTVRQLIRLIYHAQGVLCPVTSLMHLAAAVPTRHKGTRPCVVIAGGREPAHWEAYPGHQFIQNVGSLACCATGGCWKERTEALGDGDKRDEPDKLCVDVVRRQPRCMDLIPSQEVIARIEGYFAGGRCRPLSGGEKLAARKAVLATRNNPFDRESVTPLNAPAAGAAFLRKAPRYPQRLSGRGIVICAGGSRYFTNAYVCARMLRWQGCDLPIQFWHLGPEEMDDSMREIARALGVECVDGEQIASRKKLNPLGGWELKAAAILFSRFQEVLLLDADNVPLRDPSFLFETPEFKKHGAIFWPDYEVLEETRPIWRLCGLEPKSEREFESGQIVVDKKRCWEALQLALWYNNHSEFFYRHIHGDKETFHMAFRRVGKSFALVPTPIQKLRGTMCQHDFEGNRLFQHRNLAKWRLFGPNKKVRGFRLESQCREFLRELESKWDGFIRHPDALNHKFAFRPNTFDEAVFSLVAEKNEYGLPERFGPEDAILDVGAHIGSFTYACLSRGAKDVTAWEADAENCALARRNLASFGNRVSVRQGVVWRNDSGHTYCEASTYPKVGEEFNTGGISFTQECRKESPTAVKCVSFDKILSWRKRWKWVKMDCEGSEWPILLTSRMIHRIENICGEFHLLEAIPSAWRIAGEDEFKATTLRRWLAAHFKRVSVRLCKGTKLGHFWASGPRLENVVKEYLPSHSTAD